MFIGLSYIAPFFSTISGNRDFWGGRTDYGGYGLKGFFLGMLASYVTTIVIEFPFFYLAVKNKSQRRKIFFPFFIANTVTNIAMTLIYYWVVKEGGYW
jgi:hypothetical protein